MEDFFSNIPGVGLLEPVYTIARALIIALDVLLFFLFLYALKKSWKFRPRFDLGRHPKKKIATIRNAYFKDQWQKLLKKYTENPTPDSMRLAVIEGDILVDSLLKDLKFPGEHLADRLSHLNNQDIKSLEGVWQAHKLRNEVVHHPSHMLSIKQGMGALDKYQKFFKELNIF